MASNDHLTFLVLAVSVALALFAAGELPALLLPPAFPKADQETPRATRRVRGRHSVPGVTTWDHLGAPGALTAQERTGKPQYTALQGQE